MADKVHIVAEAVAADRMADATRFLAECFSLPPASARSIAAGAPIVLLAGLSTALAAPVLRELQANAPEGVAFRVADGDTQDDLPQLQWPKPPRLYGRTPAELARRDSVRDEKHIQAPPAVQPVAPLWTGIRPVAEARAPTSEHFVVPATLPGMSSDDAPVSQAEAKRTSCRIAPSLSQFMRHGSFSVIIGRTKDPHAVKMVADIMGLEEEAARRQCMRLGLCVARNISLDEARTLTERFHHLGLKARIAHPNV